VTRRSRPGARQYRASTTARSGVLFHRGQCRLGAAQRRDEAAAHRSVKPRGSRAGARRVRCVSGSGSNRSSHHPRRRSRRVRAAPAADLRAGLPAAWPAHGQHDEATIVEPQDGRPWSSRTSASPRLRQTPSPTPVVCRSTARGLPCVSRSAPHRRRQAGSKSQRHAGPRTRGPHGRAWHLHGTRCQPRSGPLALLVEGRIRR
jgi:hypothetical protein